jgi:hypothetical protein
MSSMQESFVDVEAEDDRLTSDEALRDPYTPSSNRRRKCLIIGLVGVALSGLIVFFAVLPTVILADDSMPQSSASSEQCQPDALQ